MTHEIRYRGIYKVILYKIRFTIDGIFNFPDFEYLNIAEKDFLWNDAYLTIGISDMKGLNNQIKINWNDLQLVAEPGVTAHDLVGSGVTTKLVLASSEQQFRFSSTIDLNGSSSLHFVPLGKETSVKLTSDWKNPSFTGNFLPDVRNVKPDGFDAEWRILHVNRNFPQQWIGNQYKIEDAAFGVSLLLPVDEYQKNMRTAKYAIMFIGLTFLSFFMIELLNKKVIHPVQYILIGSALIIFYTLLLSLSEHVGFQLSYLLASVAIIILITSYTKSVLANNLQTIIIAVVLLVLYGYLYIILQLQDYALLMGSLGLFIILAGVMFLTRKIDWFTILKADDAK